MEERGEDGKHAVEETEAMLADKVAGSGLIQEVDVAWRSRAGQLARVSEMRKMG